MGDFKDIAKIAGGVYIGNKLSQPRPEKPYEDTFPGRIEGCDEFCEEVVGANGTNAIRFIAGLVGFFGMLVFALTQGAGFGATFLLSVVAGVFGLFLGPFLVVTVVGGLTLAVIIYFLWWLIQL